jgi:hypothetical protein
VLNVGGPNVISVVSVSHCNATDTTGCRAEAPSVPAHEATISADPATGTIYASNTSRPQIDVLNANRSYDVVNSAPQVVHAPLRIKVRPGSCLISREAWICSGRCR